MIIWYVLGGLAVTSLIVVQQGAHYLVARACGLRVIKVRLGFGPLLFSVARGPTVLEVALIPLVGHIEIAGLSPFEEVDPGDQGSYANAGLVARALTVASGPLANYVFAVVLFFAAFLGGGLPVDDRRVSVGPGEALILAVQAPPRVVAELLANLFGGRASGKVFGGIGSRLEGEAQGGWPDRLHLLASLSACFGAANLVSLLLARRAERAG